MDKSERYEGNLRSAVSRLLTALAMIAVLALTGLTSIAPAPAQIMGDSIPSLPSDLGPLIEQQMERTGDGSQSPDLAPEDTVITPEAEGALAPALSALEESYSRRAGRPLRLIGRRAFGSGQPVTIRQTGAIQDSYVLGIGDEIVLTLRGPDGGTYRTRVNRDGNVIIRDLPPIPAAGLSFGQFREALAEQVRAVYIESEVFVSLGEVRQISVMINGEVRSPGIVQLNGLANIVDVIHLAGGIAPTGTLRNIRILRGDRTVRVDLYDFILGRRGTEDFGIAEGDQIFVPVLGSTVAVAGEVKRPGVFELDPGTSSITANDLLELGGGTVGRGPYSVTLLRILPNGKEELVQLGSAGDQTMQDGDILLVEPKVDAAIGRVALTGHVKLPRDYPLESARSVRRMISDLSDLQPQPYLPFAVVETTDPRSLTRDFRAFNLGALLRGRGDVPLRDGDRVFVFGMEDIAFLTSSNVAQALRGEASPAGQSCRGLQFLARWVRSNPDGELASGQFAEAFGDLVSGPRVCPALFDQAPELLTYLLQNSVMLRGNLLRPGVYPIVDPNQVADALAIAGAEQDARQVDILSARPTGRRTASSAGGIVEIKQARVRLTGHVRFPGTRSLGSAPMLSQLIGDIDVYQENPYLLFAFISRIDRQTFARQAIYFNPSEIISGKTDIRLEDRDVVRIFGFSEIRNYLNMAAVEAGSLPGQDAQTRQAAQAAETFTGSATQGRFVQQGAGMNPGMSSGMTGDIPLSAAAPGLAGGLQTAMPTLSDTGSAGDADAGVFTEVGLQRMLANNSVAVVGEVMLPDRYPVAGDVTLEDLLRTAGGTTRQADRTAVELTRFLEKGSDSRVGVERVMLNIDTVSEAQVAVAPGNVVRVNPLAVAREDGFIEVSGQVHRPGRYDIVAGERLSSVLRRAGGLKDSAYPYGAVYTRESVKETELEGRQRAIAELNRALASELSRGESQREGGLSADSAEVIQSLISRLESAEVLGRVVVETDPNVLRAHPGRDMLVEPGDRLVIPRRPWFVHISGEVFNPGAQQFVRGRDVYDYIDAAGGLTADADRSKIFLVGPDGSARQISSSSWSAGLGPDAIAPGSAIIVPRDLRPFDLMEFTVNIADILSKLAISAASISVISR